MVMQIFFNPAVILVCYSISLVAGNYPEFKNYKPCTRLRNTVNYQKPICLDDDKGGFEKESEKNCKESFKQTCPEFNKASCEWIKNVSLTNGPSSSASAIPCCRLKYYAGLRTWMEIYYTLQYGKEVPVYDIVEVHRRIKDTKNFANRDQNDWPSSVIDATGERGLAWTVATNLTQLPKLSGSPSDFCVTDNDTRCSTDILQHLSANFPTGFEGSRVPNLSAMEKDNGASLNYTLSSACRSIWLDAQKTCACQILYWYNSNYIENWSGPVQRSRNLVFQFLEVQAYYPLSKFPSPKSVSSDLELRYAYWAETDPETRDQFFNTIFEKKVSV